MKIFSEQYRECKASNMTAIGPVQKFKDFPELLPIPWHKAAKPIAKELKKNPDFGFEIILCKRFGGQCRSSHPRCMAMRALSPFKGEGKFEAVGTVLTQEIKEFPNNRPIADFSFGSEAEEVAEALNALKRIASGKDDDIVTYGTCNNRTGGVESNSTNRHTAKRNRV